MWCDRFLGWVCLLLSVVVLGAGRASPAQADDPAELLMAWALGRYEAAGLELPGDLEVTLDPTLATCDGPGGRYDGHGTRPRIVICATDIDAATRRVVLHELAHAWEDAHLSDAEREAFRRHRGLPTWLSHDHPWIDRAGEHFAEIVAWGLGDGPGRRVVVVPFRSRAELAADYHRLVGSAPPAARPGDEDAPSGGQVEIELEADVRGVR